MKIDWKKKLSSRKFWMALVGFISASCVTLNVDPGSIERITAIVISGASLIAYILSEGFIDGKSLGEKSLGEKSAEEKTSGSTDSNGGGE